jgi:hypothetical protein
MFMKISLPSSLRASVLGCDVLSRLEFNALRSNLLFSTLGSSLVLECKDAPRNGYEMKRSCELAIDGVDA